MSRSSLISSVVCLLAGAAIGGSAVYAAQPHMTNALGLLQSALTELQRATPNKGGHRERAIGAVERAIQETRQGIAFAGG
ncbi:MAG TPA: hypothetical protein VEC60_07400 [Reyranella sp.]|nr:hypothetical protein [Reyranella sp.]